jgi:predicted DNA-binding transcriptional regulator AlpA
MRTAHHLTNITPTSPLELPEELLTIIPVMKVRGCRSRTTVWNDIRDGTFPPPDIIIKRIRYWRRSTLRKWQNAAISANAA